MYAEKEGKKLRIVHLRAARAEGCTYGQKKITYGCPLLFNQTMQMHGMAAFENGAIGVV
jgi:hypothetical protein